MADVKISALPAVPAASGTDELMINQGFSSKKCTLNQIATFRGASPAFTGTPTSPTAANNTNTTQIATTAFVQSGGPVQVLSLPTNANTHSTTAMVSISGLQATLDAGMYVFEYYILAQFAATTQSIKFSLSRVGTTPFFCYNFFFPSQGVLAATGLIDQEVNATTGQVWAFQAARTINVTLGPETDVDSTGADILFRISGFLNITAGGTLSINHGCEVNGSNITIMAGSSLILTKVA